MGFFEFLTKKVAVKPKKADKAESTPDEKVSAEPTSGLKRGNYAHIDEFRPRSFDDVAAIIDCLMGGKPAIVYLTEVRDTTAQRVLDILSGAAYALYGNVGEIGDETYLFTTEKK